MIRSISKFFNKKGRVGYVFILPWLIGFVVFTAYPILYSLYLSFFSVKITSEGIVTSFVKFENFQRAFSVDVTFLKKLGDYFVQTVVSVPLIVILALIIALLLNHPIRFRGFFRTIFFLPVIISSGPVLVKLMDQGVTAIPSIQENIFYKLAGDYSGLIVTDLFLFIMDNMVVLLWFSGVQILIFIAALQKVDKLIYEAAKIDGASTWEMFWKVTLPSLLPMILINIIYTTVMYSVSTMNPIIEHIKSNMFRIETGFGYASAMSWIYFVAIAVLLLIMAGTIAAFQKRQ
ncbi:carbohydrate ABC transporter permease [Paenibacillus sp. 7541]|uniref:carbohydrate ABC transporter permease n=1 Tax=Paenibacillus sp. 7541 TaxID=2026236 RepID=UPI0020D17152|nr:sugar ABC transporter permease [Paenibacillus sp. 7541]